MELEQEAVRRWFSRLRSMQTCASDISHDTPLELAEFYSTKHAAILTGKPQKDQFAFCVFRNTGISVTDSDFSSTSSFHELLDLCHRPLRISIRALFRVVALELGTIPPGEDPMAFENRKTKDCYPTANAINTLCDAIAPVAPIFPQTANAQTAFKALLKKDATTAKTAIDEVVKEPTS